MAIVVLLLLNSKIDFAVVSDIMMAQWVGCVGHLKLLQVGSQEQTVRA